MANEPQTRRFRNISGHPEDLEGGKIVATRGFVDLTPKEVTANKDKLAENFISAETTKDDENKEGGS